MRGMIFVTQIEYSELLMKTPKHYQTKIQPVDAIEAWGLDFALGNVVKYIARAGKKDGNSALQDLLKAKWYLERKIKQEESK